MMRRRLVWFISIVSFLILYTTYKAIELFPSQDTYMPLLTSLLFFVMLSGMFVYRANIKVFDTFWYRALVWSGSLLMALWSTFIILSIPFDLIHLLLFLFGKPTVFFQSISVSLFYLSVAFTLAGLFQVTLGPKIKSVSVTIENLPTSFRGLKIIQISDLHVGPTIRKGYVEAMVKTANAEEPDFIFFTGDMADAKVQSILEHLNPLENLKSKLGSFYTTGNHEYYWGATELIEKISSLGFTPLLNKNAVIKIGEHKLLIGGVTDPAGGEMLKGHKPDMAKAAETSEQPDFKILLAHRPDACHEAVGLGFDLQFSGHTHAGQYFPFSLLIGLAHKYYRGLYRHESMWIYVNPGTGYWGPADRLAIHSEISLITLM
jgi:predicted MPP superfamily phosphohydrolase